MTKAEILKKIEEVQDKRFIHSMKSRWSEQDFQEDNKMYWELKELRAMLEG